MTQPTPILALRSFMLAGQPLQEGQRYRVAPEDAQLALRMGWAAPAPAEPDRPAKPARASRKQEAADGDA